METPEILIEEVRTFLAPLYKDYYDTILKGDYEIVFPGFSIFAIVVTVILHGMTGHFPTVRWNFKTENGYELSAPLDLQKLRIEAREKVFFGKYL